MQRRLGPFRASGCISVFVTAARLLISVASTSPLSSTNFRAVDQQSVQVAQTGKFLITVVQR